jgi:hypothetical protein
VLKMVEDGGKGLLKEIQQSLVGEQR